RAIVPVPLQFNSVQQWCALIAHNLLAEFYHVYREGPRGASMRGIATEGGLMVEGMMQHLISVGGSLHMVTNQMVTGMEGMSLSVKPKLQARGSVAVKSYGYIGSYISELAALISLSESNSVSNVMASILNPSRDLPGHYMRGEIKPGVDINASQRTTVNALQHSLEKIQGPPGTGKSTTIFHIITARIPRGARVLVAVESIAQKLERCTSDRMLARCERHPSVSRMSDFAAGLRHAAKVLEEAIRSRETLIRPRHRLWHRAWQAYIRRRTRLLRPLVFWCKKMGAYGRGAVETMIGGCKSEVLQGTQIFLATIASTSRLLKEWEENVGEDLVIHTVIVDECGCTTESSVALLARLNPQNLILVGDHKQLPPCSMVPPQELRGTRHDRSLLERCVEASGTVHKLKEQYRMHPNICDCISSLFYNSMLTTPKEVHQARIKFQHSAKTEPLVWCSVRGNETIPQHSKSYVNYEEVEVATRVAGFLRERYPHPATIAILTFYKGQLSELMKAVPAALAVEVLTVDSCQGSEFDHVVLSTVRANRQGKIGFVKDKQ
ncbi:P-loop containing nucleoside triphosphate hydrolase protein, partial [Baffinella frigidus]